MPLVCVTGCIDDANVGELKRALLLADRIAVPWLDNVYHNRTEYRELNWLREQGLAYLPQPPEGVATTPDCEEAKLFDELRHAKEQYDAGINMIDDTWLRIWEPVEASLRLRATAVAEIQRGVADAFVFHRRHPLRNPPSPRQGKDAVLAIVCESMPTPDDGTPWEAILDFKSDEEARGSVLALRRWISETSRGQVRASDAEDTLAGAVGEYERALRLHGITVRKSACEIIAASTMAVVAEYPALRWASLGVAAAGVYRAYLDLLLAEQTMPGRGIAFIHRARGHFGAALRSGCR